MRALNRANTAKWKKRRLHHGGDLCGNAKCLICHSAKVFNVPRRQEIIQNQKDKDEIRNRLDY